MQTMAEIRLADRFAGMRNTKSKQTLSRRINHAIVVSSLFMIVAFICSDEATGFALKRGWPLSMKLSEVQSGRQTFTNNRRDQLGNPSTNSGNDSKSSSVSRKRLSPPPGSPLSMICKDQEEFELHVGHAMDVLRTDYPSILTVKPGK